MTVITGVSGSGKSEYAENKAVKLSGGADLYYVATMEPYGEEGGRRIERHQRLRAGKGFTTIECYHDIERVIDMIGAARCQEATILLECMSNLLANEMFGTKSESSVTDKVLSGISCISRQCRHLVVVTNEVFSDGVSYEKSTEVYIKLLGEVNQRLTELADEAEEVIYSIPMVIKNEQAERMLHEINF